MKNRHGERNTYPDYGGAEMRRDFERHALTIVHDDGLHRHLRFRGPDGSVFWFDIVTWPGVLAINGDCGTYVFARVEDMLTFFRTKNGRADINPDYWSGKLLATNCHGGGGHKEYSELLGRAAVADAMRSMRRGGASNEVLRDLRSTVILDEDRHELMRTAMGWNFTDRLGDGWHKWYLDAFYEHDCQTWTFHFLWCLHAIVWGIAQYDKAKAAPATVAP